MSANYSDPPPGSGTGEPPTRKEPQAQQGSIFANENLLIDPQQSFREYGTSGAWNAPAMTQPPMTPRPVYPDMTQPPVTPRPAYPANGSYQQVYPDQVGGAWPPTNGVPMQPMPGAPYPGYAAYPGYPGYGAYPGYPGYNAYPGYAYYPAIPARPKRDTYLFVTSIAAFACSILVILGGLLCLGITLLVGISPSFSRVPLPGEAIFASFIFFLTWALAGLVGGGFSLYHSIRALFFRKPSKGIWLPRFWIFLLCYLVIVGVGFWMHTQGWDVISLPLTGLLVYLSGIFPALAILALGIRRLSFPRGFSWRRLPQREARTASWPTSWRRLTLALVSGATLSIGLALILELLFELILVFSQGSNALQSLSNPASGSRSTYILLLITAAVVAPLVEEMVKPLAVVVLIGRVMSKAEAFTLGLACGIGFNLVETTGYISQGYGNWLNVALVRSGAGLLHGFGAAMVALGWYILTHREDGRWPRRTLLALGCMGYAVLQHAVWNGSFGLGLLPGPIGTFFSTWSWSVGPVTIDGPELINIAEAIGMLIFFIYMTGRLRTRKALPSVQPQVVQPTAAAYTAPA